MNSGLLAATSSNDLFKRTFIDPHVRIATKACRDTYSHLDASKLIPLAEILQNNVEILDDDSTYKDNLLPLIVDWFSNQFFTWFKEPNCQHCDRPTSHVKSHVNPEGKQVELYKCDDPYCQYEFTFTRHNDPAILLQTRTGRCGEWALSFMIILRTLDFFTRIVYDSTDHCWNEVWSEPRQCWIHVDPCEAVVDSPLLYEVGWNKRLEYCLAVGQFEVLDVTKRYSKNFEETQQKRKQCQEFWLDQCLENLTEELLLLAPSDEIRKNVREKRFKDIEFMDQLTKQPRELPDKNQLTGRKTGSIQWRIARGEYSTSIKSRYIIQVETNESSRSDSTAPIFTLTYNCDRNTYQSTASQCDNVKNWSALTYEYESLDFKYERDWKTSYVARYETCPPEKVGSARWRFDLSKMALDESWKAIEIRLTGKIYPRTLITVQMSTYPSEDCNNALVTKEITLNETTVFLRPDLGTGFKYIDLFATLEHGDQHDEVAWQKPQLFRQTRGQDSDEWAFSFKLVRYPTSGESLQTREV